MTTTSVADTGAAPTTRERRGLALWREHASEIVFEGGVWLVPSQYDRTSVYEGTRGPCAARAGVL